jgi:hypothetical protein
MHDFGAETLRKNDSYRRSGPVPDGPCRAVRALRSSLQQLPGRPVRRLQGSGALCGEGLDGIEVRPHGDRARHHYPGRCQGGGCAGFQRGQRWTNPRQRTCGARCSPVVDSNPVACRLAHAAHAGSAAHSEARGAPDAESDGRHGDSHNGTAATGSFRPHPPYTERVCCLAACSC